MIDDVWNRSHVDPFLRDAEDCARVITTRNPSIAWQLVRSADPIEVDELKQDEAVEILIARVAASPRPRADLAVLADRLGKWALLINLAAALIADRVVAGASFDEALAFVNAACDEEGLSAFDLRDSNARNAAAARSLAVSLNHLQDNQARRFVELGVFPEDTPIPYRVLQDLWDITAVGVEQLAARFAELGLARRELATKDLHLHDVIRRELERQLGHDARALHRRLVRRMGAPTELAYRYAWLWYCFHRHRAERDPADVLFDYAWLEAKLVHTDPAALLADFQFTNQPGREVVEEALRRAAPVLATHPSELPAQLCGRIVASSDTNSARLLAATRSVSRSWLRPLRPCLRGTAESLRSDAGSPVFEGHRRSVRAIAITPDGEEAVTAGADRSVRIWELTTGSESGSLPHPGTVHRIAMAPNGRSVVTAGSDFPVRVWDLEARREARSFQQHAGSTHAVAITPDGHHVITASADHTVRIWELESTAEIGRLRGHAGRVIAVAITSDGRNVITSGTDSTVRIWEFESRREIGRLEGHEGWVLDVSTTPDDATVITAGGDHTVRMWNFRSTREIDRLEGHKGLVPAVAITPSGRSVLTGAEDQAVRAYDLSTRELRCRLTGDGGFVTCLAVSDARAVAGVASGALYVLELIGLE